MVDIFVIMVYDFNEKRVAKVLKIGRKYLKWIQNSLLEGELTKAKFEKLKMEVEKIMDKKEDTVRFYILRTKKFLEIENIGVEKGETSFFL